MAEHCNACAAELEGAEKFCGACGAPVQVHVTPATPKPRSAPDLGPKPKETQRGRAQAKAQTHSRSSKGQSRLLLGALLAMVAVGGGVYLFTQLEEPFIFEQPSQTSPPAVAPPVAPVTDTSLIPVAEAPQQPATNPVAPATSAVAPATSPVSPGLSNAVEAYVAQARQNYVTSGIADLAHYTLTVPSCADCAPFLIYCVDPISSPSDLNGRVTRAFPPEGTAFVKRYGGNAQLLSFGDVAAAMQRGLIKCSVSGGMVPK